MTDTRTVTDRIRNRSYEYYYERVDYHDSDGVDASECFEDGALFGFELACAKLVSESLRVNEPDPVRTGLEWAKWLREKLHKKEGKENGT